MGMTVHCKLANLYRMVYKSYITTLNCRSSDYFNVEYLYPLWDLTALTVLLEIEWKPNVAFIFGMLHPSIKCFSVISSSLLKSIPIGSNFPDENSERRSYTKFIIRWISNWWCTPSPPPPHSLFPHKVHLEHTTPSNNYILLIKSLASLHFCGYYFTMAVKT